MKFKPTKIYGITWKSVVSLFLFWGNYVFFKHEYYKGITIDNFKTMASTFAFGVTVVLLIVYVFYFFVIVLPKMLKRADEEI